MNTRTEVLLYNAARSQSLQIIRELTAQGVTCLVEPQLPDHNAGHPVLRPRRRAGLPKNERHLSTLPSATCSLT